MMKYIMKPETEARLKGALELRRTVLSMKCVYPHWEINSRHFVKCIPILRM